MTPRQLVIIADMEGASGIFDGDTDALRPGTPRWEAYGRDCLTSDILAVCEAANDCGIEDILLYDGHFAGVPGFNVRLERLPANVRVFDVPDRRFFWRRIRGQAQMEPFGVITVGQHARFGEPNAYFAHTIQSPPIAALWANGLHIAEIGMGVLSFAGAPYLANIGCAASMKEARELSPGVACIAVKDKKRGWEPSPEETRPLIRAGVLAALQSAQARQAVRMDGPCAFAMDLMEGYAFAIPAEISWKGTFAAKRATWEAPTVEIGLELFHPVRAAIVREDARPEG